MDNTGKIKKYIIIITIIIIIALLVIIIMLNYMKEQNFEKEVEYVEPINLDSTLKRLDNYNKYYLVYESLTKYFSNINGRNSEKIINMLDEDYKKNKYITNENVFTKITLTREKNAEFDIRDIFISDSTFTPVYCVYGKLFTKNNSKDIYLIMYEDIKNTAFSVCEINEEKYNNIINNKEKLEQKNVELNKDNKYSVTIAKKDIIASKLLYNYKKLMKNDLEEAYKRLDDEYRNKKFNTFEDYKKYINNIETEYVRLKKIKINEYEKYKQYILIDQNDRYYIFNETAPMKYSVMLDAYTIDLPDFIEKYNSSTDKQKILLNIQKVFEAINNKDYGYVYNKLDKTYRENNFKNLLDFENYMKNSFFENNKISAKNGKKQNDIYMYKIVVEDKTGINSTKKEKDFIMQLKEERDFVMSFSK